MIVVGLSTGWTSTARAQQGALQDIQSLRLDFGKKAVGKCVPSADGIATLLTIRKARRVSLKNFQSAVRVGPYQIRLWASVPGTILGTIEAGMGSVGCELRAVKGGHDLLIGKVSRKALLPQIAARSLKTNKLLIPYAHPVVSKEVDGLIKKKQPFAAIQSLHKYERRGVSEAYTQFRMAEIHVIANQIPTAHARYNRLYTRMPERGMGLWARARSAELAYVVDGKRPDLAFVKTLSNEFVDDSLGQFARRLVANVLLLSGHAREALSLALNGKSIEDDRLIARILPVALRRAYWNGDAYGAALDFLRAKKRLKKSAAENADTYFWAGEALYSLDLPLDAARAYQLALQLSVGRGHKERIMVRLVGAYQDARSDFRALQTADYYLTIYSASPHAPQVRLRLAQLKLREGDKDGAAKEIAKLPKELGRNLRQTLKGTTDARLAELLQKQPGVLKKLDAEIAKADAKLNKLKPAAAKVGKTGKKVKTGTGTKRKKVN
jgi:tetratricopeptide (TPR) repeat protein